MDKITTVRCDEKFVNWASITSFEWDFINDLSAVTEDENAIIEILLCRLNHRKIYTWIGPLLLALNPGKLFDDLYDETQRKSFVDDKSNNVKKSTPHIYAVANRAHYRLVNGFGKINQVIVISGESGTGKTFNARKALDFLAEKNEISINSIITNSSALSCTQIIRKIANVIPLVSAFSTARTTKNSRSSRHGQLLRLQYEKNGVMRGARIHSFLLERTRVTECCDNFEIFYQLMYGLSDLEIDELLLSRDDNYTILGNFKTRNVADRCFAAEFRETVESLETLGFTDKWRIDIFRVIALLVHMGNIRFKKKIGEGCTIDLANEESRKALKNACALISLPEYELTELLTTTLICPQSSRGRHTSYRRELKTPEDCRNRLFSIARFIYDRLFNWLVERINETISANDDSYNWLGILDIFGFESFDYNGLEQLCINYATERLQLYFMEDYLEAGQRELQDEGLGKLPPSLTIQIYRDRLFVIEEIVFSTFNDASQSPIPPMLSTLRNQLIHKRKKVSNFLSMKNDVFLIEHYSCSVQYSVNNLLSKNTDKVPTELSSTLGKCKNKLLLSLLDFEQVNLHGSRVSPKKCTTLGKLKHSLDCLVKVLNECDSHYVRCARPRRSKDSWAKSEFKEQLAGTGIFDTLPLARCKLPVKFQYDEFYKRYSIKQTDSNSHLLRDLRNIVDCKDLTSSIHLGKSFVYFTEAIFFDLENYRKNHRSRCAKKIQRFWIRFEISTGQKCRTENFAPLSKKKSFESMRYNGKIKKLAQHDGDNFTRDDEEFEERKNVSGLTDCERKILQVSPVLSADTGYSSNMTIGDESHPPDIKSRRPSDISTSPSQQDLLIDEKLVETEKFGSIAPIDSWKDFYVRNWLKFNQREIKYTRKAELPKNSTLIVNFDKFPLFYRNRILSRRCPVENKSTAVWKNVLSQIMLEERAISNFIRRTCNFDQ